MTGVDRTRQDGDSGEACACGHCGCARPAPPPAQEREQVQTWWEEQYSDPASPFGTFRNVEPVSLPRHPTEETTDEH